MSPKTFEDPRLSEPETLTDSNHGLRREIEGYIQVVIKAKLPVILILSALLLSCFPIGFRLLKQIYSELDNHDAICLFLFLYATTGGERRHLTDRKTSRGRRSPWFIWVLFARGLVACFVQTSRMCLRKFRTFGKWTRSQKGC